MIGSVLFGIGSAPGVGHWAGAQAANLCFVVGAVFFSAAALVQLLLSGPRTTAGTGGTGTGTGIADGPVLRPDWVSAAIQFVGALLFNVSTTSALYATSVLARRDLVWSPDAGGSTAFLLSGAVALVAGARRRDRPAGVKLWADRVNMLGCVAFGVSAVAAFVSPTGVTTDPSAASLGTFVGAVCFFAASAMLLPGALGRRGGRAGRDPRIPG